MFVFFHSSCILCAISFVFMILFQHNRKMDAEIEKKERDGLLVLKNDKTSI